MNEVFHEFQNGHYEAAKGLSAGLSTFEYYKPIWPPQTIDYIEGIAKYIARDSKSYAESIVERIFQPWEKLTQSP